MRYGYAIRARELCTGLYVPGLGSALQQGCPGIHVVRPGTITEGSPLLSCMQRLPRGALPWLSFLSSTLHGRPASGVFF